MQATGIRTIGAIYNAFGMENELETTELYVEKEKANEERQKMPLKEMEFSARLFNQLKSLGINTIGDACGLSKEELTSIEGLGAKSLDKIIREAYSRGLCIKGEENVKEEIETKIREVMKTRNR